MIRYGKLVDKKLVHKANDENVLIYNLRRIIPKILDPFTFETKILPILEQREKDILSSSYQLCKNDIDPDDEAQYHLIDFPCYIWCNEKTFIERNFSENDIKLFSKFYERKNEKKYILKLSKIKVIDPRERVWLFKLLSLLDVKEYYLTEEEKANISDILEKVESLNKKNIFYAYMHIDLAHDFFFEHSNEHVPGVMVIEGVRQFYQSIIHKYGKQPFEGVQSILSELNSKFYNFIELNYPIKMEQEVNNFKLGKEGYWTEVESNVNVYQKNEKKATFHISGKFINKRIFKRFRTKKTETSEEPRFKILPQFDRNISIRNELGTKSLGRILDISKSGFRIEFDNNFDNGEPFNELSEKSYEFFLYFQKIGFVHGKCEIRWQNDLQSGFSITDLEEQDKENLEESIKQYCFVIEEREYL